MKRVLRFLVLLTLIACVEYPVSAEAAEMPNWDDYTYEELVEIRTELDAYIQKLEKQYAIEHGNRTIILNESEQTIYQGKTFAFTAEVKKWLKMPRRQRDLCGPLLMRRLQKFLPMGS